MAKEQLLDEAERHLPPSPLDDLIRVLAAAEKVAEMTGLGTALQLAHQVLASDQVHSSVGKRTRNGNWLRGVAQTSVAGGSMFASGVPWLPTRAHRPSGAPARIPSSARGGSAL